MNDTVEQENLRGVTVTSMPSSRLLDKFRNLPAGFAFLAFDGNGVINLVLPDDLSEDGGKNHIGALTARAVLSLCGNQQVARVIDDLVRKQQETVTVVDEKMPPSAEAQDATDQPIISDTSAIDPMYPQ